MTAARTYLDHNATSPMRPEALAAYASALPVFGNPSSVHAEGRAARRLVEDAREAVAALVDAAPREIVFLSGGTEANNAILWAWWDSLYVSAIEHISVLDPARNCGARLFVIRATSNGIVDPDDFAGLLEGHAVSSGRALVSVQLANNETGVVQPVARLAELARARGIAVHTDAVQAAGRMEVDFAALGVNFMTLSAHKLGGPKGVGALVIREGAKLEPFLRGGGQERRMRAGTENVPAVAAFGAAARAALAGLAEERRRIASLRDRLEKTALSIAPGAVVVGRGERRLCNTALIVVPGHSAEKLVIGLDISGVAVGAGAACSSGKVTTSHVLTAMGLPEKAAEGAIRVSLGWNTREEDVEAFLAAFSRIVGRDTRRRKAVA
jgi:cysteine desulfurase